MRIVFFGSDPWFSPPVLEALAAAGHEILLMVSKGEVAAKFKVQSSKFKIIQTKTDGDITRERLDSLIRPGLAAAARPGLSKPNVIVLAAFGPPFLPAEVLTWPKYGCLNVHASLLPRWRGASPVFGAIANGDKKTGVSIMRMTKEIDLGPILGQAGLKVSDNDNRETLTRRLGILGGKLIVETLKKLQNEQINEVKQPLKSPTLYTHRLTKDLGRINWDLLPGETSPERSRRIERFIRAVTPWPGAWANAKFKVQSSKFKVIELKILKAHLERSPQRDCHAPTGVGARNDAILVIDEVQLPGKNPISWKAFLAGHPGAKFI